MIVCFFISCQFLSHFLFLFSIIFAKSSQPLLQCTVYFCYAAIVYTFLLRDHPNHFLKHFLLLYYVVYISLMEHNWFFISFVIFLEDCLTVILIFFNYGGGVMFVDHYVIFHAFFWGRIFHLFSFQEVNNSSFVLQDHNSSFPIDRNIFFLWGLHPVFWGIHTFFWGSIVFSLFCLLSFYYVLGGCFPLSVFNCSPLFLLLSVLLESLLSFCYPLTTILDNISPLSIFNCNPLFLLHPILLESLLSSEETFGNHFFLLSVFLIFWLLFVCLFSS